MIPIPSSRSPPGNRARLPVERRVESGGEFVGAEGLAEDGGACGQPLVPTAPQSRVQIFSNYTVLAGAPLRNRTVDLLLTMHTGFVC